MTHLETKANEDGSYTITAATNFTPTVAKWHLLDEDETVVNSRSSVSISSPSTAMSVTLTSDDCGLSDSKKTLRYFVLYGTYNGGSNSFSDYCTFNVRDVPGIS